MAEQESAAGVEDVVITGALDCRPARSPDHRAEAGLLAALAAAFAERPDAILQTIVEQVVAYGLADVAGVGLREPAADGERLRWSALAGSWSRHRGDTMPLDEGPCGVAIARGKMLLLERPERVFPSGTRAPPLQEMLVAPLHVDGQTIGAVWLGIHGPERRFDAEDARLLRTFSDFAGAACRFAGAPPGFDLAREDLSGTRRLYDLLASLTTESDLHATLKEVVAASCEFLATDRGCIQLVAEDGERLEMFAYRGYSHRDPFVQYFLRNGTKPAFEAVRGTRRRLVIEDVATFPPLHDTQDREVALGSGVRAAQSTPMVSRSGALIGVLSNQFRAPHRPSEDQLRLVDLLAWTTADFVWRQRQTQSRNDSEARLRQFGEASSDVLWVRNAGTLQWEYLSPAFETIYGMSVGEALAGDTMKTWADLIVPEDRERAVSEIMRVRTGERVTFEYRIRQPDGALRWLRNTDFPMRGPDGEVERIGGVGQDVTELKRIEAVLADQEARLRTLMEGIPQLVWRAVGIGLWTWASPQWLQFTGQSQEETHELGWLEAVHPDDRDGTMLAWRAAEGRGQLNVEHRLLVGGSTEHVWHHTRALPVRDEEGRVVEWLGTSTDVDELRNLQEHQKVLVAELQHRTRNLMGVVRSMSDKTARASTDLPDFRARFRDRLDSLARVQGLLSRLSDVDRVTFDDLIRTEISAMDGGSERVRLDGPSGVRLRSSTVQTLAMAMHELATNAVKYGALAQPDGQLAINWSLERAGPGGKPWLHIDWRESGITVPAGGAQVRGQGRELIEQALPYQLSAETTYAIGPDGVRCTIAIPVSESTMEVHEHA